MKYISVIVFLFSITSFANQSEDRMGCQDIDNLLYHIRQDNAADHAMVKQVKMAYDLFCLQTHRSGEAVFYSTGVLATEAYNVVGTQIFYPNGEVAIHNLAEDGEVVFYPNGQIASYGDEDFLWSLLRDTLRKAKIEAPFNKHHKTCASGCTYISWGIWGDEAHKKRPSCHNSGEAIDIHAIKCKGKKYGAGTRKFSSYLKCMKRKFHVIFGNKKHKNHAHIQFHNCKKIKLK